MRFANMWLEYNGHQVESQIPKEMATPETYGWWQSELCHMNWTSLLRRSRMPLILSAVTVLATLADAQQRETPGSVALMPGSAPAVSRGTPQAAGAIGAAKAAERQREGTRLIDVMGSFQAIGGDSVSFSPAASGNKDSFRVLQNLALERISNTLEANRGPRLWVVSGTITEYRGSNYLLVSKAQLQEGDSAAGQ
jgi:hypothetical protein